jgi:sugar lactone lactonase YvrE
MFIQRPTREWPAGRRRILGLWIGLVAGLNASPSARATSYVTVDGHPPPVTLVEGEDVTLRFDVARPGGAFNLLLVRDLAGTREYDRRAPTAAGFGFADGASGDLDPASRTIAAAFHVNVQIPAGPYIILIEDRTRGSFTLPGVTIVPRPHTQAISGRVVLGSSGSPAGAPPPGAIVWAYANARTPVASASIQPDGSYSLPVPPGTYLLFAEWFGSLHSQRQVITLAPGQQRTNVTLPLQQGQEVTGTVRIGGQPLADALVEATAANGTSVTTRTFADGSYLLVLPGGRYRITSSGSAQQVTVADGPVDGVDFPITAAAPNPVPGTIVTVAGNGIVGFGGDGRPAITARVPFPLGLAVDRAGHLYIADNRAHRVRRVAADTGLIATVAGSSPWNGIRGLVPSFSSGGFDGDRGPAARALLNVPQHVAVDARGNLYISDLRNARVRKVDPSDIITTVAGNGVTGFRGDGRLATGANFTDPQGVAVDRNGSLYIADTGNQRVRKVSPDGIITTVAGGGNGAVSDGARATAVALSFPTTLAVDRAGNLFIGDGGLHRILRVTPTGIIILVAGTGTAGFSGDGGPATAAQFDAAFPLMAVDGADNLFIADANNHRVRKITPNGIISTVAGSGPVFPQPGSFAGDGGPATAARLNLPGGLAVDAAGNLLIVDILNRRVRKVVGIAAPTPVGGP